MLREYRLSNLPRGHVPFAYYPKKVPEIKANTTEYRDVYNKIGDNIMKSKIHNHTKCGRNGRNCFHVMYNLKQ
jgi:hypothetical protein